MFSQQLLHDIVSGSARQSFETGAQLQLRTIVLCSMRGGIIFRNQGPSLKVPCAHFLKERGLLIKKSSVSESDSY